MANFHTRKFFINTDNLKHGLKLFPSQIIAPRVKYRNGIIVMKTSVDPRLPSK